MMRPRQARLLGFTLLEVIVAMSILSLVSVMIYSSFFSMSRSRDNLAEVANRYQQGRAALDRMSRELSAAFVSTHRPFTQLQPVRETIFLGSDERPADRVDFTSFSYRRLRRDAHESDQAEISYFGSIDPDEGGKLDLVRRVSKYIDEDPTRGGIIQVLAEDIDSLELLYLDPVTGEWLDSWDSSQDIAQLGRLPSQIWIILQLKGGARNTTIKFETKTTIPIQAALNFAGK
jgi:general secretion pathway protein J